MPAATFAKYLKHPLVVGIVTAIVSTILTLIISTKPAFDQSAQQAVSRAVASEANRISKLAGSANGFIVGEIRSFAFDGENFEGKEYRHLMDDLRIAGWVECRGQAMPKKIYADLYERVGSRWGRIDDETARFPDLRGVFLRGWNHSSDSSDMGGDPDVKDRTASVTGQDTDRVGSSQPGALQLHSHKEFATFPGYGDPGSSPMMNGHNRTDGSNAQTGPPEPLGASVTTSRFETRPKNKYVLYCIYTGVRG
jgi:microcystin-dependent protein